jgi:nucleotide-binding universal stress UspA family protein
MSYKTLLTVVTPAPDADPRPGAARLAALRAAIGMARAEDAHLDVIALGVDRTQVGYAYPATTPILYREMIERAQSDAVAVADTVRGVLAAEDIRWAVHTEVGQVGAIAGIVARHARFADLALLGAPTGDAAQPEAEAVVEAVLFEGECPAIILPAGQDTAPGTDRIVIGWNQSAEALAAVRRALPLLQRARDVAIAIIDPPSQGVDAPDPGVLLSQMLARHGVPCEIAILPRTLPRVGEVLTRYAQDRDADMLVMGAYGHSRFRESIFGGATRSLLRKPPVPIFMTH